MENVKSILITGGSGLIGKKLTELLLKEGYNVSHLGRSLRKMKDVRSFQWDVDRKTVDLESFQNIDTIIHLAGAGVNDKRWDDERKREILKSRTESTRLLHKTLEGMDHHVKTFVSASGIGYYGFGDAEKEFVESDPPGNDFLAQVTAAWEGEVTKLRELGLRVVKIRIGVVLSPEGGALKELARPVKLFAGAPLGSGDQYLSWIHIDDLCQIFMKAIKDTLMQGAYNAVAPQPVSNKVMTQAIAKALKKPLLLPNIPGFIIKMVIGDVAEIVLNGSRVSAKKIEEAGFSFQFKTAQSALDDLLK